MVAQDSHTNGPRRHFSAPVTAALVSAMRAFDETRPETERSLRVALEAAAWEARATGMPPEEVIIALKEARTDAGVSRFRTTEAVERFHTVILRGMLSAYFAPRDPDE
jgi:hypothetical protein